MLEYLALSMQDVATNNIYTQKLALEYLGKRLKITKFYNTSKRSKSDAEEARDLLSSKKY